MSLLRMLIQEENRLKNLMSHSANLVQGADKALKPKAKKLRRRDIQMAQKWQCRFCKKEGHFQKDFPKRKA